MQYGFLLDSCDVILLCIVSQISNKMQSLNYSMQATLIIHEHKKIYRDNFASYNSDRIKYQNKNLAIANRPCISCAHNTLRASVSLNITL